MVIEVNFPRELKNNFTSYANIIDLFYSLNEFFWEDINIDFTKSDWINANLSAVIGAVFDEANKSNTINLVNIKQDIKNILSKNEFLSYYGYEKLHDSYNTTIKYKKFNADETRHFTDYIYNELFSKIELPTMSDLFRKEIAKSFLEIFENARMHGNCQNVYTCGQYFPRYKLLDFTIVDLGNTIKRNVSERFDKEISGIKAINWAVKNGHTTKQGESGGFGLDLTREFIQKNKGKIQIISADGYWEQNNSGIICKEFNRNFPGTVVNFEINIDDSKTYKLANETIEHDVF